MMVVNALDPHVVGMLNGSPDGGSKPGSADELRNNFMTLLIAQLQNQDPLNPLENAEITSQLAQLNTVNGIEELNTTLASITRQMDASQALQAVSLIGKGVLVPGDRVLLGDDGAATAFGIELSEPADLVEIVIVNATGQIVRKFAPFEMKSGVQSFVWDGLTDSGHVAPPGAYRLKVNAFSGDKVVEAVSLNYAVVTGVSARDGGSPKLDLGGISDQVSLEDVRQIL